MGVISQLEDGHFYLEDLTASVEINLSNAISFTQLFFPIYGWDIGLYALPEVGPYMQITPGIFRACFVAPVLLLFNLIQCNILYTTFFPIYGWDIGLYALPEIGPYMQITPGIF